MALKDSKLSANADNTQNISREIPFNYTSWTDREIVKHLLDETSWKTLENLQSKKLTGQSARMLYEVLGDIWAVKRNPYLEEDLIIDKKRRSLLLDGMSERMQRIQQRTQGNQQLESLIAVTQKRVITFTAWFDETIFLRARLKKRFREITRQDNIAFDPLSRVSHVTDASDWRVEYPFVILLPDQAEEIALMVTALKELGLSIIPRGGGTGYTGSVVPLDPLSAVINSEKLECLHPIEWITLPSASRNQVDSSSLEKVPTIRAEAGVVTRRVMDAAEQHGLVFAVDPTSADASCIGGNIAMNAGGKKAVLWGTTLDNLLSWKMIMPEGDMIEVTRLDHHCGKIHDVKKVTFEIHTLSKDGKILYTKQLTIPGHRFRRIRLGKDVTDKFLAGLPGIQKEGCDGFIIEARFILHRMPSILRTFCIEFYGRIDGAVNTIEAIKNHMHQKPEGVALAALEHLDVRYLRSVGYSNKTDRTELPRMILLGDIAGDDESAVDRALEKVVKIANEAKNNDSRTLIASFVAKTPKARRRFWADRGRTAAIAKHTNAFKINEDVVIPLNRLGEYNDGIEHINVTLSLENKITLCDRLFAFFSSSDWQVYIDDRDEIPQPEWLEERTQMALDLINEVRKRWQFLYDHLSVPLSHLDQSLASQYLIINESEEGIEEKDTLFQIIQYGKLRISWKKELLNQLSSTFQGKLLEPVQKQITRIHQEVLKGRLFVALHMHAGDGNVHTNIPVNSDNGVMMKRAYQIVDQIMTLTQQLDGVISGEHGIGLTKMTYLTEKDLQDFWQYKRRIDPDNLFNRHKLMRGYGLHYAYTPSFSLIGHESLLLENTELGNISESIKNCLRCGKCKPVCATHVPRANILYSPRNKVLATSLLIEAILYEAQTRRGISHYHNAALADVGDHCTVCHKCYTPCPVNIDFGDVSIMIRQYLNHHHQQRTSLAMRLTIAFLSISTPRWVRLMRLFMINIGFQGQRFMFHVYEWSRYLAIRTRSRQHPNKTTGTLPLPQHLVEQVVHFVNRPLPNKVGWKSTRALLNLNDTRMIPIIRNMKKISAQPAQSVESVFYFPGCGSEKLFSQVGLATQAMLYHLGVQCVLPPTYLCCGYPQLAAGYTKQGENITTLNRVMFHRIAHALNYLNIKTVIVSCGTCIDQLEKYQFTQIFPGCRLMDIHEYLMEKNVKINSTDNEQRDQRNGIRYLYHDPCHTPIKIYRPGDVVNHLIGKNIPITARCCGEAGTLAVSRPDIANQVRFSKQESIQACLESTSSSTQANGSTNAIAKKVKILTTCPSCLQGLSRYQADLPISSEYVVVEIAEQTLGKDWQKNFIESAKHDGIEQVLL